MKGKKHRPEEIVTMVREAEAELAKGTSPAELARKYGVTEWTLHRWRQRYGGLSTTEAKRLRALEKENERLKRMVAQQALENQALKEISRGNF